MSQFTFPIEKFVILERLKALIGSLLLSSLTRSGIYRNNFSGSRIKRRYRVADLSLSVVPLRDSTFRVSGMTIIIICFFAYWIIGLFLPVANALTMSNAEYIIQMSNLNTAAGKPSNSQYNLGVTVGQIAPGLYSGPNYKVRAGFQYISSIHRFSFKISPLVIDFGSLSAGTFVTRNQNFTVNNGSAYGYSVTVAENHSLLVPATGSMIPNTSCNSGTCTTSTAGQWDSSLTYGFGIRCEYSVGSTCASDFNGSEFYRPIADLNAGQDPAIIASSSNVARNQVENVTYKINVSSTQQPGEYTNQVIFIATPTF